MLETIADIEALVLRCRSDQSREYISEAVLCYRSGAYRAAIVGIWIAVVFDLIDKIRELAIAGDGTAKLLEQQHVTYVQQMEQHNEQGTKNALEFERDILSICRERLLFFDQQQYADLLRLREDRHRCAHPSFQRVGEPYRPSAEQARLHLRNAIVYVLSQPPVQGKAALAELTALVTSAYFPTDAEKALAQLRASPLAKSTEVLAIAFLDAMLFGFLEQGNPFYSSYNTVAAINALHAMFPALVERRLETQLRKIVNKAADGVFGAAMALVAIVTSAWRSLDGSARDRVVQFIRVAPSADVAKYLGRFAVLDGLRAEVESRTSTLSMADLVVAIQFGLGESAKSRALQLVSESQNWTSTNALFDSLINPYLAIFDADDVVAIMRAQLTGADLIGARGFGAFVGKVRDSKIIATETLNAVLEKIGARNLIR